jgi:hypothetical protein
MYTYIFYICVCKYNMGTFDTIFLFIVLAINDKWSALSALCSFLCVCGRMAIIGRNIHAGLILLLKTLLHLMKFNPNFAYML